MITVTLPFDSIEAAHAALGTLMVQQLTPKAETLPPVGQVVAAPQELAPLPQGTFPPPTKPAKKKRGRPAKIMSTEEIVKLKADFEQFYIDTSLKQGKDLLNEFPKDNGQPCRKFTDLGSQQHRAFAKRMKELS